MVHPSRYRHIVIGLSFGLSLMCATARAQQAFSTPKNISNNSDYSFTPQAAVYGGSNIYAVWEDDTNNNSNILFSRSTDSGATFSAPMNLSKSSGYSFNPRIAVDAFGSINVVWEDNTPGNQDIFFSRSTDGGATFTAPKNLSNDHPDSVDPQVALDASGNINVVWRNRDITFGIFYARSTDGGANFSTPVNLAANVSGSLAPQVALETNGNIDVVWQDDFNSQSDVSFSRSADKGLTFSAAKSLSSKSFAPQISVDAKANINVTWLSNSAAAGTLDVFFSRSTDSGVTFSNPKNISNGPADSGNPQVGGDQNGNIFVAWNRMVPPSVNNDIFFSRSTDGGITFSAPMNLSNNTGDSTSACLTVDASGNVNVSWLDTTPGNSQVLFSQSVDHGVTFSPAQNLSNDAGYAADVQMAADSQGNLNVVWDDDASGFNQIFFSRLADPRPANQPPVAIVGPDQIVPCTGHNCALVTLDGSQSSDPDGDTLSFVWRDEANNLVGASAIVQFTASLGAHTYTLTVTDAGGLASSASTHVTIQDKTPPTLGVSLSPNVLGAKSDKMVLVKAAINVSDLCDPNPTVKLVSITSNDPADRGRHSSSDVEAAGGGSVAFGTDVRSFWLRAEHPEHGKPLVYTITYSATDASGNTTTATAQVSAAHHAFGKSQHGSGGNDDDRDERKHSHRRE